MLLGEVYIFAFIEDISRLVYMRSLDLEGIVGVLGQDIFFLIIKGEIQWSR